MSFAAVRVVQQACAQGGVVAFLCLDLLAYVLLSAAYTLALPVLRSPLHYTMRTVKYRCNMVPRSICIACFPLRKAQQGPSQPT